MSIESKLRKGFPQAEIHVSVDQRGILTLTGSCTSWHELVQIGHKAAKQKDIKNVVNHMTVPGLEIPRKD